MVKKLQKNSRKDSLGSHVHTLNNLLTNVMLSSEMLLAEYDGKLNARQKKITKTILSEGKKMADLVKKINNKF